MKENDDYQKDFLKTELEVMMQLNAEIGEHLQKAHDAFASASTTDAAQERDFSQESSKAYLAFQLSLQDAKTRQRNLWKKMLDTIKESKERAEPTERRCRQTNAQKVVYTRRTVYSQQASRFPKRKRGGYEEDD